MTAQTPEDPRPQSKSRLSRQRHVPQARQSALSQTDPRDTALPSLAVVAKRQIFRYLHFRSQNRHNFDHAAHESRARDAVQPDAVAVRESRQ